MWTVSRSLCTTLWIVCAQRAAESRRPGMTGHDAIRRLWIKKKAAACSLLGASTPATVDESTGSADGVPAGRPSRLIRMADTPDLWGEDPPSWDETRAYYPGTGAPPASDSTSSSTPMPPGLDWVNVPSADRVQPAQPRHAAEPGWPPRSEPFGSTGESRRVPTV